MAFLKKIKNLRKLLAHFRSLENKVDGDNYLDLVKKIEALEPILQQSEKEQEGKQAIASSISGSVGAGGDNNKDDVKTVQALLNQHGASLAVDGAMGPNTISAIKDFQSKELGFGNPDGRVDVGGSTWGALSDGATPTDTDTGSDTDDTTDTPVNTASINGSVGDGGDNDKDDVKVVQELLNQHGASLSVDGAMGPNTINAIKDFQSDELGFGNPDGRVDVGGTTWGALSKGTTAPTDTTDPTSDTDDTDDDQPIGDASDDTTQDDVPSDLQANSTIKKSVGDGGDNDPADVLAVQKLLKETWEYNVPTNGVVKDKTIQAIRKFQYRYAGMIRSQDSRVDPGGKTWKYLTGELKPEFGKSDDGVIGGAETEAEEKMAEFTKAFSGIQIEVGDGEIVNVRPPYHINLGKRLARVKEARKKNSKVAKVISKLGYGGSVGKATPSQIEEFLEECIKKNLIKDKTSQGMHDFLAKYGVSTDCSGLAVQAANFLAQGDMDRAKDGKGEEFGIQNTASIQRKKEVSSPSKLKAGDMMVNYKREGTSTYHVRIIVDVDKSGEGIQFTTVESGSSGDLGDGGNGVGQRRWEFPDATKFDDLKILKGNDWQTAGRSDQAYTYTRFDT